MSSVRGGGGSYARGVSVEVGEEDAVIDLSITIEYGRPVRQVSEAVRKNVTDQIKNLLGLEVTEVNIQVNDVFFPEKEQQQEQERQQEQRSQIL